MNNADVKKTIEDELTAVSDLLKKDADMALVKAKPIEQWVSDHEDSIVSVAVLFALLCVFLAFLSR